MKHGTTNFEVKGEHVRITDANGCFVEVKAQDCVDFFWDDPHLYKMLKDQPVTSGIFSADVDSLGSSHIER